MRRRLALLLLGASLGLPATAGAQDVYVAVNRLLIDDEGWPVLRAEALAQGALATVSWKRCSPDCGPAIATGDELRAGPTAAGTTFEASAVVGGVSGTERSATWLGRLTNTAPPTVAGRAIAGRTITPAAGSWRGGWGNEDSELRVRMCRSPSADDCRLLRPARAAVLDPVYVGWYVGALERRFRWDGVTPFPAVADLELPQGVISKSVASRPGQTVAAGPLVGPIAEGLRFTPTVTIPRRATKVGRQRVVATVRCRSACTFTFVLSQGAQTTEQQGAITKGSHTITWPEKFTVRRSMRVAVRFEAHALRRTGTVKPLFPLE